MNNSQATSKDSKKLGLIAMTMLVFSAMVGGGVFNLPQNMAQFASLGAVLIAWLVSGLGIFFLARTLQVLADIKPELTSGIYMYSRTGFGKYAGFQIAWGYWLSSAFGNVGFGVLLMDTLNAFFPPYFKGGNTWEAVILASILFWIMNWLVLRGIKGAAALNIIGTVAKFIPLAFFILIVAFSMKAGLFGSDFWGHVSAASPAGKPLGSLLAQVKSTMLVTLWVFIGIEGAVVMSDRSDARPLAAQRCWASCPSPQSTFSSRSCRSASCRRQNSPQFHRLRWQQFLARCSASGLNTSSTQASSFRFYPAGSCGPSSSRSCRGPEPGMDPIQRCSPRPTKTMRRRSPYGYPVR